MPLLKKIRLSFATRLFFPGLLLAAVLLSSCSTSKPGPRTRTREPGFRFPPPAGFSALELPAGPIQESSSLTIASSRAGEALFGPGTEPITHDQGWAKLLEQTFRQDMAPILERQFAKSFSIGKRQDLPLVIINAPVFFGLREVDGRLIAEAHIRAELELDLFDAVIFKKNYTGSASMDIDKPFTARRAQLVVNRLYLEAFAALMDELESDRNVIIEAVLFRQEA